MSSSPIVNVAEYLPQRAEREPARLAVVFPEGRDKEGRVSYTHFTFQQLHRESDRLASGLEALGLRRGTRTVLMVKPSLEFFALTFALFKVGAALILIDPGMGRKNLGRCLDEAEPEAFLGIPRALLARSLLGWGKRTIRLSIAVGPRWWPGSFTLHEVRQRGASTYTMMPTQPDEMAAILFTSGSTGPPKGAIYTHQIFTTQVETLRQVYDIQSGEIDLTTFPLFALFAPALGMTAIVPEMDATRPALVDPVKIIEAIDNFGVTNLFGSPALLRRVGEYTSAHAVKFPSLRRVFSAGAPVPASVIEQFQRTLRPEVEIFTPYGATESLPVCSLGSAEILGETRFQTDQGAGVCVGRPVPGITVGIIQISDDPIAEWSPDLVVPDGTIGEIAVKGAVVTQAYYGRPEATKLAKIVDRSDGGWYHRMGDLGYRDAQGRIWFCGRKAHRVQTSAGTLYTIPCEAIFNTHPLVARTALVGVGAPPASRPVLCVELKPNAPASTRESVKCELLALAATHKHTQSIKEILFHKAFPVDIRHNSKIFREKLAVWAARELR